MFAQHIFHDFKENVKSSLPTKTNTSKARKGLKSYNQNNFSDSTNILKSKKDTSEKNSCDKPHFEEKENSKPKVKIEEMINRDIDDSWSDIEEMHICIEPDDDYEDILPQCERIQKVDIDSLFLDYCPTNYTEIDIGKPPSPLKELPSLGVSDFSSPLPEIKATLFDDSELYFIPLPNNLF